MKIMAIWSTGTSGILRVSHRNLEKETAASLKCIDQLPQNAARVQNLVHSVDTNHKSLLFLFFLLLPLFSIVHQLLVFCSNFNALSEVHEVR